MNSATILHRLFENSERFSEKTAFRFVYSEDVVETISFSELARRASRMGAQLAAVGQQHDRVLIFLNPGIHYVVALFGIMIAQKIPVPVQIPRPKKVETLGHLLDDADVSICLTAESFEGTYSEYFQSLIHHYGIHVVTIDGLLKPTQVLPPPTISLIKPENVAFLQYTSGSTGHPKGAIITHQNLMDNLMEIQKTFQSSSEDIGVFWLPPYHDMGLVGTILEPVYLGMTVTLMSPLSFIQKPYRWLDEISQTRATVSGGPNFAFDLCVRRISDDQQRALDLSSLRVMFSGAERIRRDTFLGFIDRFSSVGFDESALLFCYGMAEATLIVSGGFNGLSSTVVRDGQPIVSCGRPINSATVAIVKPHTQTIQPEAHIGEIWVSGPGIFQGYWQRDAPPDRTAFAVLNGRSFLKTGDEGFIKDNQLYVTGRIKEILIVNGKNYYPQDIESVVRACTPMVNPDGIAAFAIEKDNQEQLVLVCEILRSKVGVVNTDDLRLDIQEAIGDALQLTVSDCVFVLEMAIPRTSSGKLKRLICQEMYRNHTINDLGGPRIESEARL